MKVIFIILKSKSFFQYLKKFLLIFVIFLISFLSKEATIGTSGMSDYCYAPPMVGTALPPNVLLIIDVSGSMGWCAYNPKNNKEECCNNSVGCGWNYRGNEEGYFEPDKIYEYRTITVGSSRDVGAWIKSNSTSSTTCPAYPGGINTNNRYKGSCLNFHYMRRIDLVRWALTGGTLDSCNTGVNVNNPQFNRCNPMAFGRPGDQTSCNATGCLLKTYKNVRVFASWDRINGTQGGLLFQFKSLSPQPRIGLMEYSDRSNRPSDFIRQSLVYIGDFVASANYDAVNPYKNVITSINAEDPYGGTPTGPVLWDAYNYFAQRTPQYGGFQPQTGQGDQWKNYMYQCEDANNDGNCQGNEFKFVYCAKNFIILLTDGQWNTGYNAATVCTIDHGFEDRSADPVVPAYWLHKRGFNNTAANNTYSYVEAIYGIGLWLGGTGERSLKNVAMYGSFDRYKSWPGNLTGYPQAVCGPVDDCCTGVNCGKGSSCANLPPSSPDWDKDGDDIPDTFFSASDAKEIKDSIMSAILDILRRASSGATVATLSQRVGSGAILIQPYFFPRFQSTTGEISWIGSIKSFWTDFKARIREDLNTNKILDVLIDKWILFGTSNQTSEGTKIYRILDENTCSYEVLDIFDVKPLFDAGCLLANRNYSDRTVYVNLNGTLKNLTDYNIVSDLTNIWNISVKEILGPNVSINNATTVCIINYLMGSNSTNCPNGNSTFINRLRDINLSSICSINSVKTWKLGDIVYSTPTIISNRPLNTYHLKYGDISYLQYIRSDEYKKRNAYVLVGANDGMLHAFRIGWLEYPYNPPTQPLRLIDSLTNPTTNFIGKEEWAFIPFNALPYLVVYGMNDYCHIFTADYKVSVFDAKINEEWKTLLLGVMGFGAKALGNFSSSIYLLDLTPWLNGTDTKPSVLWERTLPDKTLTLSYFHVIKIQDKWYVVIGSGPEYIKGAGEGIEVKYPSQAPKLFFFDLANGTLVKSLEIPGVNNQAVGAIRPVDYDKDYSDDLIYFGTYNKTSGQLFRLSFKMSNGSYKSVESLTNADIKVALENFPARPIFSAPELTMDLENNLWVIFGTGVYFGDDKTINYNNYFVGFKDICAISSNITCTKWTDLQDRSIYCRNFNNYNATVLYNSTETTCEFNPATGQVESINTGLVYAFFFSNVDLGWYHQLENNERMYSQPLIIASLVNALSYIPSDNPCEIGGNTFYWNVCYLEGCPCISTKGENIPEPKRWFARGAPPLGQPFQIVLTQDERITILTQTSETGPSSPVSPLRTHGLKGRFIFWIEK